MKKEETPERGEREGLLAATIPSPEQKETRGVIAEEAGEVVAGALCEAEVPFT